MLSFGEPSLRVQPTEPFGSAPWRPRRLPARRGAQCRLVLQNGTRVRAQVKPYVVESKHGPIELADLFLENGSAARAVRFASFRFLDK
jgi:hypothetical protein